MWAPNPLPRPRRHARPAASSSRLPKLPYVPCKTLRSQGSCPYGDPTRGTLSVVHRSIGDFVRYTPHTGRIWHCWTAGSASPIQCWVCPVAVRGCRSQATPFVSDSIPRPSPRRRGTRLSRAAGCCSAVSAEGAFAGGWLPAGRVRRQGGVGLQRQHHGNLLTRFGVGGA